MAAVNILDKQQDIFLAILSGDERKTLSELLTRLHLASQSQLKGGE
jgi:hypothetical protein